MFKQNKSLTAAIILIIIYYLSISQFTGIIGGIILLLAGWIIPSLVNVFLSYWLVTKLKPRFPILCFILISFILGLNIQLFYLFIKTPTNLSVEVVKPIYKQSSTPPTYVVNTNNVSTIIGTTLPWYDVQMSEGCGCVYFSTDKPFYQWLSLALGKLITGSNTRAGLTNQTSLAFYAVSIDFTPGWLYASLKITITDKNNGKVIISGDYPQYFVFSSQWESPAQGMNMIVNTAKSLLANNFWNFMIRYGVNTIRPGFFDVKLPLEVLNTSDLQKIFVK